MPVRLVVLLCVFSFTLWGCPAVPTPKPESLPPAPEKPVPKVTIQELAGQWEYQEGSVNYPLMLDQEGKGTYEWMMGRFETTSVSNGKWKGHWYQKENDREGGFELQLQPDLQSATGTWWYTRIENDQNPLQPGGTFTLHRVDPTD